MTSHFIKQLDQAAKDAVGRNRTSPSLENVIGHLVENAIDAGASQIQIKTREKGYKRISIIDDGKGIAERDLDNIGKLWYTGYASSPDKYKAPETFGFRGEAINAICGMVRKFELTTKDEDSKAGYGFRVTLKANGEVGSKDKKSYNFQTEVVIEGLFDVGGTYKQRLNDLKSGKTWPSAWETIQMYATLVEGVRWHASDDGGRYSFANPPKSEVSGYWPRFIADAFSTPLMRSLDFFRWEMLLPSPRPLTNKERVYWEIRIAITVPTTKRPDGHVEFSAVALNNKPIQRPEYIVQQITNLWKQKAGKGVKINPFVLVKIDVADRAYIVNRKDKEITWHNNGDLNEAIFENLRRVWGLEAGANEPVAYSGKGKGKLSTEYVNPDDDLSSQLAASQISQTSDKTRTWSERQSHNVTELNKDHFTGEMFFSKSDVASQFGVGRTMTKIGPKSHTREASSSSYGTYADSDYDEKDHKKIPLKGSQPPSSSYSGGVEEADFDKMRPHFKK
ncbi:hypothetical protein KCU78_g2546, partial [Aureobasidium melanogenum]